MITVYILFSEKFLKTYVGYTTNINERIKYHNNGKVLSTKYFRPWKIIYTESAVSIILAKQKERYWKSGAGRRNLKRILGGFPPNFKVRRGSPK